MDNADATNNDEESNHSNERKLQIELITKELTQLAATNNVTIIHNGKTLHPFSSNAQSTSSEVEPHASNIALSSKVEPYAPNSAQFSKFDPPPIGTLSFKVESQVPMGDQSSKVELYAPSVGPKIYNVKGNNVTPPIIPRNLPKAFQTLPIFGRPESRECVKKFNRKKIREFVGLNLNDEEFDTLSQLCSSHHLRKGHELEMTTKYPTHVPLATTRDDLTEDGPGDSLCLVKKFKLRLTKDTKNLFTRSLKYRGIRILPPPIEVDDIDNKELIQPVQPGEDLIFIIRVYRPFQYSIKDRQNTRHSIFNNEIVMLGRQTLAELRDRIVCANDASIRTDLSMEPDAAPAATSKEMFPSGFMFINNVFYVDERAGCHDTSAPVRNWASGRGLGVFPRLDLSVRLDSLHVRLGHPEVYVHQGSCEHLFAFSQLRLAGAADPLAVELYPLHGAVAQNQTLYCTTCAEFGARWVVTGCSQVPFDPAFFCDTCLRLYLYRDGVKVCDFKAYQYRGNEINVLKPQT